jgi:hypothetical protein
MPAAPIKAAKAETRLRLASEEAGAEGEGKAAVSLAAKKQGKEMAYARKFAQRIAKWFQLPRPKSS